MTTADMLRLDGNAIAGVLREVFGVEMTARLRACPSCRARNAIGAYHLYRGAGMVLRCPACSDTALLITRSRDGYVLCLQGVWTLELPRS